MQDLKDITSDVHYENYRAEHLAAEMNRSQRERRYIYVYRLYHKTHTRCHQLLKTITAVNVCL